MTARETNILEKLRETEAAHHNELVGFMGEFRANCQRCQQDVAGLKLEIYGQQPEDEKAPGLKADVKSLKQSRTVARWGLRAAWAAILSALTAWIAAWAKARWGG